MWRWLLRRLVLSIPVVWGVITISFVLMRLAPGDPARNALGDRATQGAIAALRHQWGLDRSPWAQYVGYLGGVLRGDLGQSLYFRSPITSLMEQRLPVTLMLMVLAALMAVVISVPLATLSTTRRGRAIDQLTRILNAVLQGAPAFLIGGLMLLFFGVRLAIFPAGGFPAGLGGRAMALVLPAATIALGIVPLLVRGLKAAMAESLSSEYVAFARSKGLSENVVRTRYVLRNASISGVSILGIQVGALASGALVVEQVFAIPGMGSMLMSGILNRDYVVVQACTLVFGLVVVLVYLLTDIAYAKLDPRTRLA
jgi:peptide/nickel transport system permease protein